MTEEEETALLTHTYTSGKLFLSVSSDQISDLIQENRRLRRQVTDLQTLGTKLVERARVAEANLLQFLTKCLGG